jgi:hypothetical protein
VRRLHKPIGHRMRVTRLSRPACCLSGPMLRPIAFAKREDLDWTSDVHWHFGCWRSLMCEEQSVQSHWSSVLESNSNRAVQHTPSIRVNILLRSYLPVSPHISAREHALSIA